MFAAAVRDGGVALRLPHPASLIHGHDVGMCAPLSSQCRTVLGASEPGRVAVQTLTRLRAMRTGLAKDARVDPATKGKGGRLSFLEDMHGLNCAFLRMHVCGSHASDLATPAGPAIIAAWNSQRTSGKKCTSLWQHFLCLRLFSSL